MLKKNLHLCFSRIHCLPSSFSHALILEQEDEHEAAKGRTSEATGTSSEASAEADLSRVFSSQRFFFSSPGSSKSILEERRAAPGGGVPVRKHSRDPYADFRQSMEEMVEATPLNDSWEECEYLRQLLMCYLSLNPEDTHKFIIAAFTDLLLSLMSSELPVIAAGVDEFLISS